MSIQTVPPGWFHAREMSRVMGVIAQECTDNYPGLSTRAHKLDVLRPYLEVNVDMRSGHFNVVALSENERDRDNNRVRRMLTPEEMGQLFPVLAKSPLHNLTLHQIGIFAAHWVVEKRAKDSHDFPVTSKVYRASISELVTGAMEAILHPEEKANDQILEFTAALQIFYFGEATRESDPAWIRTGQVRPAPVPIAPVGEKPTPPELRTIKETWRPPERPPVRMVKETWQGLVDVTHGDPNAKIKR